jgi:hypothetical protein
MASLLCLRDVEKLSDTLQSFWSQIIIKKMRNPFETPVFHVERSGQMEMHRRRRNLEELSDRLNLGPSLSFQDLQNSSIDIFENASAGDRSVTQIRMMYRVSHIRCSTAHHEKGCTACPQREQGKAARRRLTAVKTR